MQDAPFPISVNLPDGAVKGPLRPVFQAALRGSLKRRGFDRIGFDCDGDELLAIAERGNRLFGAVYNMPTGRVLLQDAWAAGEAGREILCT